MADLGAVTELINAKNLQLRDNSGADIYVALTDLVLHGGRVEVRDSHTGLGAVYSYGAGDHWMTFTLTGTPVEINSIIALNNITGTGDMTSNDWEIRGTTLSSGETITLDAPGFLRDWDLRKAPEGKVKLDCFVRITSDTIVVTVV